ncbi:MAG: peptidylprolyl isomerase [Bacteroidota bacterium]
MRPLTRLMYICILVVFYATSVGHAQSKNDLTVVGKLGKQKVTYAELKENARNGSFSTSLTLEELEAFLPKYLDYKAKLLAAKDEGYYEDSALVAEYQLYSKQASYAFWMEKQIRPTLFDDYKEKATKEIKSAHILIAVSEDASPEDTIAAITKLNEARQRILDGIPLMAIESTYSTMRNGRSMGGGLPWISVGTTVKDFEDQVYSLSKGELSKPFRTQFGYHIVQAQDIRERTPARMISHIFIRPQAQGETTPKQFVDSAYYELNQGVGWTEVLNRYSQDDLSKPRDGDIGWVSYGKSYRPEFIDSVMNLDPSLPYSAPVQSPYGYHIFRVDSVQSYASEKEKDEALMKELENQSYFSRNNSMVVNWLRDHYSESPQEDVLEEYQAYIKNDVMDSTLYPEITLPSALAGKTIYAIDDVSFTVEDYHQYLQRIKTRRTARQYQVNWIAQYTEYLIDERITEWTLRDYPEFINQTETYRDGLVVFKINDDNVWSSATVDTAALLRKFESDRDQYQFSERFHYHLLSARYDTTLQKGITFVLDGNPVDSVRVFNNKIALASDSTGVFKGEPFNKLESMNPGTFSEPFEYSGRTSVFYLNAILPSRPMTFEEAFNRILSEYQPEREERWLKNLRKRYKVKTDVKKLRKAFKTDEQNS